MSWSQSNDLRMLDGKSWIGAVQDDWQMFSDRAQDYTIGRPIGHGASSIVYSAFYNATTPPTECAIKVLDLDKLPLSALRLLMRETQLMSLSKHPNVLRVRGSWMDGHKLYIALRLMRKGSIEDIIRYSFADGMEEEAIKCILKQALEGLDYLHTNGCIHRDIKAANLLVDDDGTVLLADLGVAALLTDDPQNASAASRKVTISFEDGVTKVVQRENPSKSTITKRNSFVGTPCWMAPEVVAQKHYDEKADIWSIGITALELTRGRAPHSREPAFKVLMKTLQDAPPSVDRGGGLHKYSRAFKEVIDSCLAKDPALRPTAAQLLQSDLFRNVKKKSYLVGAVLGMCPKVSRACILHQTNTRPCQLACLPS
ncbi:hypothetical protein BOTBODRAFT_366141 [Botryobasidium botryosum FD-172 SS1]|uniref:Protein kinase domain-containing protein n=1 Tax=Botryobasidium botryosum (strain FD-172 SS1) TaxID=930990 RepID=A0A067MD76_BOTB1|nr:hypothetical protein BOTBODRAFT_366141 [Botryobasidium botryosum FD-172 SS1]